jgi:phosphoribosylanthranilate isomerase
MTRIKICGITNAEDAQAATAAGAHALGFVFAPSARQMTSDKVRRIIVQLPPFITTVGVFADAPLPLILETVERSGVQIAQLHGEESPEFCEAIGRPVIKRFAIGDSASDVDSLRQRMAAYPVTAHLLDSGFGSGRAWNPSFVVELLTHITHRNGRTRIPLMVAGGLNPINVANVIRTLRPFAVDVCSGVEASPGKKDARRISAFVSEVNKANALVAS